jgi:hypothetical protein
MLDFHKLPPKISVGRPIETQFCQVAAMCQVEASRNSIDHSAFGMWHVVWILFRAKQPAHPQLGEMQEHMRPGVLTRWAGSNQLIDASAYYDGPKGGRFAFYSYPLPFSRLASSFSRCAPIATNPKVYAEHYSECRGYHIGSLHELPYTRCDPVVPLLVAFYDPR